MATTDAGEKMMLVYEHKTNGRKLVPGGLSALDEEELVMIISMHPDIRMVNKPLEPSQVSIDIFKADLVTDEEKKEAVAKDKKTAESKEEVPWKLFLGHEMIGHSYAELVILVPEVVAKGGKEEKPGK